MGNLVVVRREWLQQYSTQYSNCMVIFPCSPGGAGGEPGGGEEGVAAAVQYTVQ